MEQLPRYAQLTTVEYEKVVERFEQLQTKIERLKKDTQLVTPDQNEMQILREKVCFFELIESDRNKELQSRIIELYKNFKVDEIERLQTELTTKNEALDFISKISFNTGRASLLGQRIIEMIRQVNHPMEPCPNCNGIGKVPNPEGVHCSSCKSFHEYPMGPGGSCGPWSEGKSVRDNYSCLKHEFLLALLPCNHCGGKPFIIKPANSIEQALNDKTG